MNFTNKKTKGFALLAIVVLCTAFTFAPIRDNTFTTFDDNTLVTENPFVKNLSLENIKVFFTQSFVDHYHPLVMVSFALEYRFSGLNPRAYYRDNLIVHLLNCVLVFVFLFALTGSTGCAFFVSLLFGIHPMHVESVAWISERKDVLYTFFFLAGLVTYLRYCAKNRAPVYYWATVILFTLSLFCKSMAVTFPPALLLIDYFRGRTFDRRTFVEKIPFAVLSAVFIGGIIHIQFSGAHAENQGRVFAFLPNILTACHGITFYLEKLLYPVSLSALYPALPASAVMGEFSYWMSVVAVGGIVFAAFTIRKVHRDVTFGLLFFAVTISPVLQIVPSGMAFAADRYTYVPYLGLFFIVARYGRRFYRDLRGYSRVLLLAVMLAAIVAFGVLSWHRCSVWKNTLTLWQDGFLKYPNSAQVCNNLGMALYDRGHIKDALPLFQKAIHLSPEFARAWNNVGICYNSLGKDSVALGYYEKAINLMPGFATAYYNRGLAERNLGRGTDAVQSFKKAIECKPDCAAAFNDLGISYAVMDSVANAAEAFQKAIYIDPGNVLAYQNLGVLYIRKDRIPDAIGVLSDVVRLDPRHVDAYFNLGVCFARQGKSAEAIREWRTVLRVCNNITCTSNAH
jgi:tetratricopeptide (TPR) repeat protein